MSEQLLVRLTKQHRSRGNVLTYTTKHKEQCRKRSCFSVPLFRRIGEYISIDLFCTMYDHCWLLWESTERDATVACLVSCNASKTIRLAPFSSDSDVTRVVNSNENRVACN